MADKKNPLGPTGASVRDNVARFRKARRLTYRELSDRLEQAGRPIPTLGLSRIEKGERRVDADDLVALASVLGVNPSALLLPHTSEDEIDVTGVGTVSATAAWGWADGRHPLVIYGNDDVTLLERSRPPAINAGMQVRERFNEIRTAIDGIERDVLRVVPLVHTEHGRIRAVFPSQASRSLDQANDGRGAEGE